MTKQHGPMTLADGPLTLAEAAKLLGRNDSEVRRLAAQGSIPATKIKGRWTFLQDVLEDWAVLHPRQTYRLTITADELVKMVDGKTYKQLAAELTAGGTPITSSTIAYKLRGAGYTRKRGRRKNLT